MDWKILPKVELHLHLDCSLSYTVVSQIDPSITLNDYRQNFVAPAKCNDLLDFLGRVPQSLALLQTKEQLHLVTLDLFEQLRNDNVLYAEIRFAPLLHTEKGLTPYDVVATVESAAVEAVRRTGVQARFILCTLRHYSMAESLETVKLVEDFHGSYVAGFDIASNESLPFDAHIPAFHFAHENGIPCTAHAGEACGPESVWETLKYAKPLRIGHGVRSIEDPILVEYLRDNQVHLEVSPTCNIQTNVYPSYADHPINELYLAGVSTGINTDTRGILDLTLSEEYEKLHQTFGWDAEHFYTCNINALKAAFVPDQIRDELLSHLGDGYKGYVNPNFLA